MPNNNQQVQIPPVPSSDELYNTYLTAIHQQQQIILQEAQNAIGQHQIHINVNNAQAEAPILYGIQPQLYENWGQRIVYESPIQVAAPFTPSVLWTEPVSDEVAARPPKRDECYPRRSKFKTGKKVKLFDPTGDLQGNGYKVKHGDIGTIIMTYRYTNKQFEVSIDFGKKGKMHFMDKYLTLIGQDKKPAWF